MQLKTVVIFISLQLVYYGHTAKYTKYKVYQVTPQNDHHLNILKKLENNINCHFWSYLKRDNGMRTVMVSPNYQKTFEHLLRGMHYRVVIEDFERVMTEEKRKRMQEPSLREGDVSFDKYLRYKEIQNYLTKLANKYGRIATVENYGSSYEGRNLTLFRISTGGAKKKPIIFFDAGIHANEWLGPAQALYLIYQLIENPENEKLIKNVDWIVVPLVNPDGYEYTHTTDRLWRKTRSKGKLCDGVDANRNFDFHWLGEGGDKNECSDIYAGPTPFSEPETRALSQVILTYADYIKLYLTAHTPFQTFLHPWGYTSDFPPNKSELLELGLNVAQAIYAVNGTRYDVGSSVEKFTYTAGSSRDWAYGVANISLSYTVELPPGPLEENAMPPENILAVVTEMFEGIRVFHKYVEQNNI